MLRHIAWGIGAPSAEFAKLVDAEGRVILAGLCAYFLMEIADYLRRRGRFGEAVNVMPAWGRLTVYYFTTIATTVLILLLLGTQVPRITFIYAMF